LIIFDHSFENNPFFAIIEIQAATKDSKLLCLSVAYLESNHLNKQITTLSKPIRLSSLFHTLQCELQLASSSPSRRHSQGTRRPSTATPSPSPCTLTPNGAILIAEDNVTNQRVLARFLAKLVPNLRVDIANNGQEAVRLYQLHGNEYVLVLMDCQMPICDGFEATRQIREDELCTTRQSRIPIVAITANAMYGDGERCIMAGMDNYLPKPISSASLKKMLHRYLKIVAD